MNPYVAKESFIGVGVVFLLGVIAICLALGKANTGRLGKVFRPETVHFIWFVLGLFAVTISIV